MMPRTPPRGSVTVVLIREMWRAAPGPSVALALVGVVAGLVPIAYIVTSAYVVGELAHGVETASSSRPILVGCVAIALLFALQQSLLPMTRVLTQSVGAALNLHLRDQTLDLSLGRIGLAHLEQSGPAALVADAALAGSNAFDCVEMILVLSDKLVARTQGFGAALLLCGFRWWAPLIVWAAWSLLPTWIDRVTNLQMTATTAASATLRRASYFRQLALRAEAAKELRIFNLQGWLAQRFRENRSAGFGAVRRARERLGLRLIPLLLPPAIISAWLLVRMVDQVLAGSLSAAAFTAYGLAIISAKNIGHTMAWWVRGLHHADTVGRAATLRSQLATFPDLSPGQEPAEGRPAESIVFENISFAYDAHGQGAPVLRDFNLVLPAGKSTAIVGENGAGKTTLVKLLARFYDPQRGRILIDGSDLREFDPDLWRRQLAVIFQDFIRYEGTARENIALDRATSDVVLGTALDQASARHVIERLPRGLGTLLSRAYVGGTDLSSGQWQRIALARAFAAVNSGARVLVLDEPTANLDVRAEAELFERFLEITRGLTTLLISHRLSTVRHADRICVVEHGQVVEAGSHGELMALGGRYTTMFNLQARRFAEETKP